MKKIIFLGTPKIAACILQAIHEIQDIKIAAVFCQPDRELDRKGNVKFQAVKQYCIDNHIIFYQPENINKEVELIKSLSPDLIVTCAYGQFISENILNIPKYKCVNFHASLLPKLRGGAPIHWAIINGEKQTGFSLMYMEKKMDAGDIIKSYAINIDYNDTYFSLYEKLCVLGQEIVKKDLLKLFDLNLKTTKQDEGLVTFGLNITKEQTIINFNNKAIDIYNLIRGLYDKPIAKFKFNNEFIKVHASIVTEIKSNKTPGTIISITKKGVEVATKDFNILLTFLQLPSKKANSIEVLINGSLPFKVGDKLI